MATVNVNVLCCHAGYEYDNKTGRCIFKYAENDDVILRQDYSSQKYIYVRVSLHCNSSTHESPKLKSRHNYTASCSQLEKYLHLF